MNQEQNFIHFNCPHCFGQVIVAKNEINCSIFRHAVYKQNGQQINPHTPKDECDRLFNEGQIFGCGKPFRVDPSTYQVTICDYI